MFVAYIFSPYCCCSFVVLVRCPLSESTYVRCIYSLLLLFCCAYLNNESVTRRCRVRFLIARIVTPFVFYSPISSPLRFADTRVAPLEPFAVRCFLLFVAFLHSCHLPFVFLRRSLRFAVRAIRRLLPFTVRCPSPFVDPFRIL